jgi:SpoVK/Ycf46/Vps4 family AAA+-type ATPase
MQMMLGKLKNLNTFLLQIEKDDSSSLIIAATNLPNMLDTALFRRFDDIIQYPLPTKAEILKLYENELSEFKLAKKVKLDKVASHSLGLSFADIHRICEDIVKNMLVYGDKNISEDLLISYATHRKQPF